MQSKFYKGFINIGPLRNFGKGSINPLAGQIVQQENKDVGMINQYYIQVAAEIQFLLKIVKRSCLLRTLMLIVLQKTYFNTLRVEIQLRRICSRLYILSTKAKHLNS